MWNNSTEHINTWRGYPNIWNVSVDISDGVGVVGPLRPCIVINKQFYLFIHLLM